MAPSPRLTNGFRAEDEPLFVGLTAVRGSSLDASTDPTAKRHLYFYPSRSENTSGSPGQTDRILPACLHPGFLDARRVLHPGLGFGAQPSPSLHREATGQCLATSRGQSREGARPPAQPHPRPPLEASRVLGDSLVSALFSCLVVSAEAAHSQRDDFFVTLVLCRHLLLQMQSLEKAGREEEGSRCCCIAINTPPGRVERRLGTGWWQRQGLC